MNTDLEFARSLRRIKPQKHHKQLAYRQRSRLQFIADLKPPFPKLLLDTCVYIDALQGRLPGVMEIILRAASIWHSAVAEAELSALAGLLDPGHPETPSVLAKVGAALDARPPHRILTPDRETWREAGMLAGLLARLQHYGKPERRKALNDALIFLTARKHGCAVLTRNVSEFDLLHQLEPKGHAIFYDADN